MTRERLSAHPTGPPASGPGLWRTNIDRASPMAPSRQLAEALRRAVTEGRLGSGARLPSTRHLATELGIARSTIVAVFEQLAAEGYIEARQGAGYFVAAPLTPAIASAPDKAAKAAPRPVSRHADWLRDLAPELRGSPRPFETG